MNGLGGPVDRRRFLLGMGALGAAVAAPSLLAERVAAALGPLPHLVGGLTQASGPALPDVVGDTFSGVAAFVVPGDDEYSRHQGVASAGPGGVATRTPAFLTATLNEFLPSPAGTAFLLDALQDMLAAVPLPGGVDAATWLRGLLGQHGAVPLAPLVAGLLDGLAVQVDPTSVAGPFLTPFPRLSWAGKADVWERFELQLPSLFTPGAIGSLLPVAGADLQVLSTLGGLLRFASGAVLELAAFGSYSEYAVLDTATARLTGRPIGWDLAAYQPAGRVDGWDEFHGYYQGRTSVGA